MSCNSRRSTAYSGLHRQLHSHARTHTQAYTHPHIIKNKIFVKEATFENKITLASSAFSQVLYEPQMIISINVKGSKIHISEATRAAFVDVL
jgi:hypothetical protein